MMKFSDYNKTDFFKIDPAQLRIKAQINSSATIDLVAATRLSAAIEDPKGRLEFNFELQKIKEETVPARSGIFSDTPAYDIYYLRLTEQAVEDFNQFKTQATSGDIKRGSFSAALNWDKPINFEAEDILFSVSLKLSNDEPYFTLIDNFKLQAPQPL